MAETRIQIAKADILKAFEEWGDRVFRKADIEENLRNREFCRLRKTMGADEFIRYLPEATKLRKVNLPFQPAAILSRDFFVGQR